MTRKEAAALKAQYPEPLDGEQVLMNCYNAASEGMNRLTARCIENGFLPPVGECAAITHRILMEVGVLTAINMRALQKAGVEISEDVLLLNHEDMNAVIAMAMKAAGLKPLTIRPSKKDAA